MHAARRSLTTFAALLTTACVAQVGSAMFSARALRAQAAPEPVAMQAGGARAIAAATQDTVTQSAPRWHFDQ